jgi:AcrR family transcriptional regulator
MGTNADVPVRRRRRGAALETALLEAAWTELAESGYDALTFDAVAARAGTSRPALYRRWSTKQELVRAAIGHGAVGEPLEDPDTGSVRGDLIALMHRANETRIGPAIVLTRHIGGYYADTGTSVGDLRTMLRGNLHEIVQKIMERGVERGELDAGRLTARLIRLPFDLYRYELLMTFMPVPDDVIEEILDTVFLPLVTAATGRTGEDQ